MDFLVGGRQRSLHLIPSGNIFLFFYLRFEWLFVVVYYLPGYGDIASPEQRAQRKPKRIGQRKVVDVLLDGRELMNGAPTGFCPSMDWKQDQRHGQKDGADSCPDFGGQRGHERQNARLLLHRFFNHNADAQLHERRAKVDNPLTSWCYCYSAQTDIGFLFILKIVKPTNGMRSWTPSSSPIINQF